MALAGTRAIHHDALIKRCETERPSRRSHPPLIGSLTFLRDRLVFGTWLMEQVRARADGDLIGPEDPRVRVCRPQALGLAQGEPEGEGLGADLAEPGIFPALVKCRGCGEERHIQAAQELSRRCSSASRIRSSPYSNDDAKS